MPELSATEHLAKLQATKKHMEEQDAELKVAAEEEQWAAEAAKKAEKEWVATEKKAAGKLSKKQKTVEPFAGQEAELQKGVRHQRRKKVEVKVLEEVELLTEATVVTCRWWVGLFVIWSFLMVF